MYKRINRELEDAIGKSLAAGTYAQDIAGLTEKWIESFEKHGLTVEMRNACSSRDLPPPEPVSVPFSRLGGKRRRRTRRTKSKRRRHTRRHGRKTRRRR